MKTKLSNRELLEKLKQEKNERKIIKPGKWSNLEPKFFVRAKLKKNKPISSTFPEYLGKYITYDENYNGDGHLALINVIVEDLSKLIDKHNIDNVLAAIEKSLNSYKNNENKKILGDLVILQHFEIKGNRIACKIKTNRKFIPKFMGIKTENGKGILQVFE